VDSKEFYNSDFYKKDTLNNKILYILFKENKELTVLEIIKTHVNYVNYVKDVKDVMSHNKINLINTINIINTRNNDLFIEENTNKFRVIISRLVKQNKIITNKDKKINTFFLENGTKQVITTAYNKYQENLILKEKQLELEIKEQENLDYVNDLKDRTLELIKSYLEKVEDNKKDLIVDWNKLIDGSVDPELLMYIEENFDEFSKEIKDLYNFAGNKNNKKNIRLINYKNTLIRLKDLRNEERELLYTECEIDYKNRIGITAKSIRFECPSCGAELTIENELLADKINEPTKCECGRKGKFTIKKREEVLFQKIKIRDLDINLIAGEYPISYDCVCLNELALNPLLEKQFNISDKVKITFLLKKYYPPKESNPIIYLEILNIEHLNKIDFDSKFDEEEIKTFLDFSKQKDAITKFSEGLFFKHTGDILFKQIINLQLFTTNNIKDGRRDYYHILALGDPGTGKTTNFLNMIPKFVSRFERLDSYANSKAGVSIASKKDEFLGKFISELGAIPRANNGYLLIDELNDLDFEILNSLPQSMETGELHSNKLGAKGCFPARFKMFATCNPRNDRNMLNIDIKLTDQKLGLSGKLIDRFDFLLPFTKKFNIKSTFTDVFKLDEKKTTRTLSDKFMRNYILYSQKFDPRFNDKELLNKVSNLITHLAEYEITHLGQSSHRCINKIRCLVIAVARFHLSNEITLEHVKEALNIYEKYVDTFMDYGIDKSIAIKPLIINGDK